MDNFVVWFIIIAFYTPIHFGLPLLVIFLLGGEQSTTQKQDMKRALMDSVTSLIVAFGIAITLVTIGYIKWAMLILLLTMPFPIMRYIAKRTQ